MAIDTTAKTLIEVKADTSQAQKAIRDLAETTAKGNAELKRQAEQSSLVSKKWEELGKSMVGLQVNDAFKRLSEGAKEATGGVLDLNAAFAGYQVAGPWGAAIGAVGVSLAKTANIMNGLGVSFADLDEKSKKLEQSLRQHTEAIPPWLKEMWASRDAAEALNQRLNDTPYYLAKVLQGFSTLYPALKKAREEIQQFDSAPAVINRGLRTGAKELQDFIADATTRYLDISQWNKLKPKTGSGEDNSPTWTWESSAGSRGRFSVDPGPNGFKIGNRTFGQFDNEQSAAKMQEDVLSTGDVSRFFRNAAYGGLADQAHAGIANERSKKESYLESAFGKIEEFDLYATGFKTLGAAIDITTGAVGASLSAWIDGSKSAGAAFKSFIAEALKGLAVQMTVEALKHGAYALGSLAFGSPATAAMHAKAAAAFAVGAAVTIPLAKALGGSGGASAGAGAGGGRAPNVSGGGGGGSRPERVIVYGDSFAEDNPRSQQNKAEKIVRRALGNTAVEAR